MDGWDLVRQSMVVALGFWDRVKQGTAIWLTFWNGVKRTWFGILTSLFMVVVITAGCYWAWSAWTSWRFAKLASVSTTWPKIGIGNDVTVEARTKCRDSVMSYSVVLVPPKSETALTLADKTDAARVLTERLRERLKAIHIKFIDKDGFPTAAYDVPIDEFVRLYSGNHERPTTLEAWGRVPCSPASYLQAKSILLSWTERHEVSSRDRQRQESSSASGVLPDAAGAPGTQQIESSVDAYKKAGYGVVGDSDSN
jgi:hypothetical protein